MQEDPELRYQQASEIKTDVDCIRATVLEVPEPEVPAAPPAKAVPGKGKGKGKGKAPTAAGWVAAVLLLAVAGVAGAVLFPWGGAPQVDAVDQTGPTGPTGQTSPTGRIDPPAPEEPPLAQAASAADVVADEAPPQASPPVPVSSTPVAIAAAPVGATEEQPFENSLGMKFVPVPGTEVLFCIHETRWKDYAAYAAENPDVDESWKSQNLAGYTITEHSGDHPVIHVNWDDAQAFCAWLSKGEGRTYRLPTDEEWSLAVGLGGKEVRSPGDTPESLSGKVEGEYPWGTAWPPPSGAGNYGDQSRKEKAPYKNADYLEGYDDGFPTISPVMSFAPNALGLYDMGGNVAEWVEDWSSEKRSHRILRGSSWNKGIRNDLLSTWRIRQPAEPRYSGNGFRVVLVPDAGATPAVAPPTPSMPAAVAPVSAVAQRLAELRTAYETAYQNGPGQVHATAVADLDAKYLAAIDRALAIATGSGDLDGAVALRDERRRVESGQPLSADDSAATSALQALRQTYRTTLADLEAQRDRQSAPLATRYQQALEAYQSELTRGGDLDGALEVKKARDTLPKAPAPAPASPSGAAAPAAGSTGMAATLVRATKEQPFENSLGMRFVPVPGTKALFCIHETRYKDYAAYAKRAKGAIDGRWKNQTADGFEIKRGGEDHPVTQVNWDDARNFCEWLSEKEGRTYRLPSDREWSLAVGIGDREEWKDGTTPVTVFKPQDAFPWGNEWPPPAGAGNYSDQSRKEKAPKEGHNYLEGYDDGFPTTAPVMSFAPNPFGLHDLGGNVWEWCEDWYSDERSARVLRGGSKDGGDRGFLFSSRRLSTAPERRFSGSGFRIVVEPK